MGSGSNRTKTCGEISAFFTEIFFYISFVIFDSTLHSQTRAAERIFIWGGGGGKDKKGHCNIKKGTNGVHADNYH